LSNSKEQHKETQNHTSILTVSVLDGIYTMPNISVNINTTLAKPFFKQLYNAIINKKAQLTQGLRATAPSLQDGCQPLSWILSNRK